jgi:hypothetical protein
MSNESAPENPLPPSVAEQRPADPDFRVFFADFMKNMNSSAHKREYEIGDECWFHADDFTDDGHPKLTHGVVICWLKLDNTPDIQYVIRPSDNKYTHMEIRDWRLMTADSAVYPAVWPPVLLRKPPTNAGIQ